MELSEIVEKINELLGEIPEHIKIGILDEEGNDTNLRIDTLLLEKDYDDNDVINMWCHQI